MNEAEQTALSEYVTVLQDKLGLHEWEVWISREQPEQTDGIADVAMIDAQTAIADEGRHAVIRVHENFFDATEDATILRELQRQTITHELLHLATDWPISDALDDLRSLASVREYGIIEHRVGQSYERMVDALAQAVAQFLPLPSWDREALRSDHDAETT